MSEFGNLIFRAVKSGDLSDDDLVDVMTAALETFAAGRCVYLASALAIETDLPIVGFWRRDRPDWPIVHAAIVDPSSSEAFDLFGPRTVADMRAELTDVAGPLRVSLVEPIAIEDGERETLLSIAAGMPWMPDTGRPRPSVFDWAALVRRYVMNHS